VVDRANKDLRFVGLLPDGGGICCRSAGVADEVNGTAVGDEPRIFFHQKNKTDFRENLYEIQLDEEVLPTLDIKLFKEANLEWLDFILLCRRHGGIPHDYDLVVGPTADDDTALCLRAYEEGLYGEKDSDEAKKTLLSNLEVENLGVQYYIGKQDVADRLIKGISRVDWR